jgi:hypothetical protein
MIEMIMRRLIENVFRFEYDGIQLKRLVYDPFMYDYFEEYNIDLSEDLTEILIKKGYHNLLGIVESELKEIVDKLQFNKSIVFDFDKKITTQK